MKIQDIKLYLEKNPLKLIKDAWVPMHKAEKVENVGLYSEFG